MLKRFRERWGRKKLDQHFRGTPSSGMRTLESLDTARRVLLIAPAKPVGFYEGCLRLQEDLSQSGLVVQLVTCRNEKRGQLYLENSRDCYIIEPYDLNWFYRPNKLTLVPFVARPFDYVVDFTPQPELPLEWVVCSVKAGMKVGINPDAIAHYDMVVSLNTPLALDEANSREDRDAIRALWDTLVDWLEQCDGKAAQ